MSLTIAERCRFDRMRACVGARAIMLKIGGWIALKSMIAMKKSRTSMSPLLISPELMRHSTIAALLQDFGPYVVVVSDLHHMVDAPPQQRSWLNRYMSTLQLILWWGQWKRTGVIKLAATPIPVSMDKPVNVFFAVVFSSICFACSSGKCGLNNLSKIDPCISRCWM